jgi:hypothetical protein
MPKPLSSNTEKVPNAENIQTLITQGQTVHKAAKSFGEAVYMCVQKSRRYWRSEKAKQVILRDKQENSSQE